MPKKVHIRTWGCQMNVYDSARMADVVAPLGFLPTDEVDDADLVIFNTCHIREKATDKLYSELGRVRPLQKEKARKGERMMVAVAGCVAQAEGAEIQKRLPWVDMVFGPQTYHQLPEMIARITRQAGSVLNTEFPLEPKFDSLPTDVQKTGVSAFLSVQEGCDKFCTFCVVPYTRGAEYSRSVTSIMDEAHRLVDHGAREITLLGQNVNAVHCQGPDNSIWGLGRLLTSLADIPGLLRLRYTTSHPRDMDDELIAAHGALPHLMPWLHLPVQSGSDKILAAMNRKHTSDDYRRTIDRLRQVRPEMAFSSDFITGFPGETDADFQETLRLVRDITFSQSFSFNYSKRPGTPAATMADQIEPAVQDERLYELQALLRQQQLAFNASVVGKTLPVLFENITKDGHQIFGRTSYMQAIHLPVNPDLVGEERSVMITSAGLNSVSGSVASAPPTHLPADHQAVSL